MRRDEAFVCDALVNFFGGPPVVVGSDGDDPPDLYLTFADFRVGVEVTRLSQFTIEPDGKFGNRATQDFFGMQLVENLNTNVGPMLPKNIGLLVGVEVPVTNASRFRKLVTNWVVKVAAAPEPGVQHERNIEGSLVRISVIPERPTGDKIVGYVVNKNSSFDILLNARLILEDRIRIKSALCAPLARTTPMWLAVLNDYWLADAETYVAVCRLLKMNHCFKRVFLVSDNGLIRELVIQA